MKQNDIASLGFLQGLTFTLLLICTLLSGTLQGQGFLQEDKITAFDRGVQMTSLAALYPSTVIMLLLARLMKTRTPRAVII